MSKRVDSPKVYLATAPNGKQYFGITTATLDVRKSEHYSKAKKGSKIAFHNALNKYGQEVKWQIVSICDTYEQAKKMEIELIKKFNTRAPFGYNLTDGGDGFKGYKLSDENRKILSESHKGYIMPQEQKDKIGAANRGVKKSYASAIKRTDIKTQEVKIYKSFLEVEEGFDKSSVYKCASGQRKQHKGFHWELVK